MQTWPIESDCNIYYFLRVKLRKTGKVFKVGWEEQNFYLLFTFTTLASNFCNGEWNQTLYNENINIEKKKKKKSPTLWFSHFVIRIMYWVVDLVGKRINSEMKFTLNIFCCITMSCIVSQFKSLLVCRKLLKGFM